MNILKLLTPKVIPFIMTTRSLAVRNARSLEKLKTSGVSSEIYENGKYIVFAKDTDSVLVDPGTKSIVWKTKEELPNGGDTDSILTIVLDMVGQNPETALFAADVPVGENLEEEGKNLGGKFFDGRKALFLLDDQEASLLSRGRGLINFCKTTNFCRCCGGKLETKATGTFKNCPECKQIHYPTLSPVGIVLVEDRSHSKALLVRGARHPRGMFSCIAGFAEPGETLEANIQREIAEEVGLDVENIQYCASQHWAMPESQLMLGCIATAVTEDFELDKSELDDGKWVDAEALADAVIRAKQIKAMPNPSMLWVPPPTAVAHTLMEHWLKKYHKFQANTTSHI